MNNGNDKEQWLAAVFDSLKGRERAKPDPTLFSKIESQLFAAKVVHIPIKVRRMALAAAIVLLILNVFAVRQFTRASANSGEEWTAESAAERSVISNYQLYE